MKIQVIKIDGGRESTSRASFIACNKYTKKEELSKINNNLISS